MGGCVLGSPLGTHTPSRAEHRPGAWRDKHGGLSRGARAARLRSAGLDRMPRRRERGASEAWPPPVRKGGGGQHVLGVAVQAGLLHGVDGVPQELMCVLLVPEAEMPGNLCGERSIVRQEGDPASSTPHTRARLPRPVHGRPLQGQRGSEPMHVTPPHGPTFQVRPGGSNPPH